MILDTTKNRGLLRIVIPAFPTFNIYSRIARHTTALGPVCIATSAREKPGWDVEVIDENNLRLYGPKRNGGADHDYLQRQKPADAVAFYGGLTSSIPRLYEIAEFYKKKGIPTIAGGQHFADENIEEALTSGLDYVVIGEGEETIQELLDVLSGNRDVKSVKGIAFRDNDENKIFHTPARLPITDFSQLPLPDFSLVRYAKITIYPVERIRGCGMDCEFCTVKGKPRPAAPERLFASIRLLVETRDARNFFIVDDLFGQQRRETIRFCQLLENYQQEIGKKLKLSVQIRWDKGKDSELLQHMRRAGVRMVAIGFESPIKEELESMRKKVRPEDMLATTREFRKFGFWIHGMFIFGYPISHESQFAMSVRERIRNYRKFITKARVDTIQVLLPVPLPGTELRERMIKQNRIYPINEIGWQYYDGNFPTFEPDPPMTSKELQKAARKLMRNFYGFRYLFMIGFKICSFPLIFLSLHNSKQSWERWYRSWRNALLRFGGWLTIKDWLAKYKQDRFEEKLTRAQDIIESQNTEDRKNNYY